MDRAWREIEREREREREKERERKREKERVWEAERWIERTISQKIGNCKLLKRPGVTRVTCTI